MKKVLRNTTLVILALLVVVGVGSLVLVPSSTVWVDANGVAHGEDGHDHDGMIAMLRERLRLQAEQNPELLTVAAPGDSEPKSKKIENPAPVPKAKEKTNVSGCLRGYGTPGQCIPGSFPDALGVSQLTTCDVLVDVFPKGFEAPKNDFANLDPNGDRVACGPGDN